MNLRAAFVFSLVIATPLTAQVEEKTPPAAAEAQAVDQTPRLEEAATKASEPARKLRLITNATTQNYVAKFDSAGAVTDSTMFENASGQVGIGTSDPKAILHVYGAVTGDVSLGIGPDPSGVTGPAMNLGYGGFSFGRGAGFFNVRPDSLAVAPNPSLRFGTANVQRMIITNKGAVGIGTSAPLAPLHINGASGQSQLYVTNNTLNTGVLSALSYASDNVSLGFDVDWASGAWRARASTVAWLYKSGGHFKLYGSGNNTVNGNPIINTYQDVDLTTGVTVFRAPTVPNTSASIAGGTIQLSGYPTKIAFGNGQFIQDNAGGNMRIFAGANLTVDTSAGGDIVMAPGSTNVRVTGNVIASNSAVVGPMGSAPTIMRLSVNGSMTVTGNITGAKVIGAVYQDLAEWVPATSDMTPGTVVVLNLDRTNEVMPSSRQYDTSVAGVVSASPGIILGVAGDSKEQIATTGRVKVRVDARTKPVRVGDLLVTSDVLGTAMRSEPMDINGRPFHQPGTIIGKALEPLEGGVGEILVLLSMQ